MSAKQVDNPKKSKKNRDKKNDSAKIKKSDSPSRKNTSLRLENDVLKRLKIRAIEEDTSVQHLLETLVLDYLDNKTSE